MKLSRRNFGKVSMVTALSGAAASQATAGGKKGITRATVIETVRFRTKPAADAKVFATYLNELADYMGRYGTLLHRTVAHDTEGNWLLTNYWTDRAAMDRVNAEFQTQPPENDPGYFQEFVDFSTMSLSAFEIAKP